MTRVAWVTGAAGGIGSAVCRRLRADGFTVVGLDLAPATAADRSVECDLGDPSAVLAAAAEATAAGQAAAIVHVAAVQVLGAAGAVSAADWARTFGVNVVALDLLVGAARDMLRVSGGAVVAISSVHATATTEGIAPYATSKAALHGWVRAAALDLGPEIRVNAIAPGAIDTPKLTDGFARWGESADERRALLESRTPARRLGTPADVADAVAFLVGDQASFVTGGVLTVDGGALTRLATE